MELFSDFAQAGAETAPEQAETLSLEEMLSYVRSRPAPPTQPQHRCLCMRCAKKLGMDDFTLFCFACAILSSTQTNYASIFQIINQNGSSPDSDGRVRCPRLLRFRVFHDDGLR